MGAGKHWPVVVEAFCGRADLTEASGHYAEDPDHPYGLSLFVGQHAVTLPLSEAELLELVGQFKDWEREHLAWKEKATL